jgi:hypothetical protein
VSSKRINWVDPINPLFGAVGSIPIPITQSYRYEGRDGRVSARQTRATIGVGHYAFSPSSSGPARATSRCCAIRAACTPAALATIRRGR